MFRIEIIRIAFSKGFKHTNLVVVWKGGLIGDAIVGENKVESIYRGAALATVATRTGSQLLFAKIEIFFARLAFNQIG